MSGQTLLRRLAQAGPRSQCRSLRISTRNAALAQQATTLSSDHASVASQGAYNLFPQGTRSHRADTSSTHLGPASFANRKANAVPLEQDKEHVITWDGANLTVSNIKDNVSQNLSQWWLRDHCPCDRCMNQITKQRQVNHLNGLANAPRIQHCEVFGQTRTVQVAWNDGHRSTYNHDFLARKFSPTIEAVRRGNTKLQLWGSSVSSNPPTVKYSDVQNGGVGQLLQQLRVYGFCYISGTPVTNEASQKLLEQIGPIRETHWGGFTEVISDMTSKDTAWSSEALEPHNDNTYFSDAAGLQMLHLLEHSQGTGGESLFVDGFQAAEQLHRESPEQYRLLSTHGIHAHSSGDAGINIQPCDALPVLRHDRSASELLQVRWNNADRAGVDAPMDRMDAWYAAASAFQAILGRDRNRYWVRLRPGTPISMAVTRMIAAGRRLTGKVFDNWRVLHGRAEFTGLRRMCGGYVNRDDYISRFKTTNYSEADLAAATVSG